MASTSAIIPVGYKQTEVGVIPEDWLVVNIDSIAKVKTGAKDTQDKVDDGVFPFFVRSQKVERVNSFSFDGEAVLTAGDGVGTGKIFHYIFGKFEYHQRVYCMSGFSNCTGKFFYYQFSTNFYDRIMSMTAKSSVDSVRRAMITQMQIPLPPDITEQDEIAGALSDSDSQIQALENLISKKRDIKQGTMQELLTGKTRLPGFSGEWDVQKLGEIADFINGRAYSRHEWETSGIPVCRLQNLTGSGDTFYYSNLKLPEKQYMEYGDLIFMWSASFGPYIWKGPRAIYHYHIWKIQCNQRYVDKRFFYHALVDMTERLKSKTSGSTMLHLTKEGMEKYSLSLPLFGEQEAIAEVLSDMDAEITALEQRLEKTKAIKQGMMQQLLTGRIRLVEPSTPVEASA